MTSRSLERRAAAARSPISAPRRAATNLLLLGLAGGLVGACGSNVHAPLAFEFAPQGDACQVDDAQPPDGLAYYTLRVCPSAGGACVRLVDPAGDHVTPPTSDTIGFLRNANGAFTIDAQVERDTLYDVTAYAYVRGTDDCEPRWVGRALGVRFGQDPVRVRFHPVGAWTCAGVHADAATGVPRALHQAVALPNGEVLLIGGVTGSAGISGFMSAVGPNNSQTRVEVFDPRDARFHDVTVGAAGEGISRVMFEARFVGVTGGEYEIRLFGGYDLRAVGSGGFGFDSLALATAQSVLFGPISGQAGTTPCADATDAACTGEMVCVGARPGDMPPVVGHCEAANVGFQADATLFYDPDTRTARLEAAGATTRYTTAGASEGATPAVVAGIDVVGVGVSARPTYHLAESWIGTTGLARPMLTGRSGATVTELGSELFLVWGGNVQAFGEVDLTPTTAYTLAGELIGGTTALSVAGHDPDPAASDDFRPWATAYHGASRISGPSGGVSVLFVGGWVIGASPSPLGARTPANDWLTVATFDADGGFVQGERVPGPTPVTSRPQLLSSVTPLDPDDVLVIGGASASFAANDAAGYVGPRPGGHQWVDLPDLEVGRWGHTTTVIPGYGVLVVGGIRGTIDVPMSLDVIDAAEFLPLDELPGGVGVPPTATCDQFPDAGLYTPVDAAAGRDGGMTTDAGARDAAPVGDAGAAEAGAGDASPGDAG